jgi:hypothetical protein
LTLSHRDGLIDNGDILQHLRRKTLTEEAMPGREKPGPWGASYYHRTLTPSERDPSARTLRGFAGTSEWAVQGSNLRPWD